MTISHPIQAAMLIGVLINTNRLFGCEKATGKVFIVLSSPPNHLERESKEEPPRAHHRDHDHAGHVAARRDPAPSPGGSGGRRPRNRGSTAHRWNGPPSAEPTGRTRRNAAI